MKPTSVPSAASSFVPFLGAPSTSACPGPERTHVLAQCAHTHMCTYPTYTYAQACTHMHSTHTSSVHTCACVHMWMCTCITHMHVYTSNAVFTCMCTHIACMCVYIDAHMFVCACVRACLRAHLHMRMYSLTCVHIGIFTHPLHMLSCPPQPTPTLRTSWSWPRGQPTRPVSLPRLLPLSRLPRTLSLCRRHGPGQRLQPAPQAVTLLQRSQCSQNLPRAESQQPLLAVQELPGCFCLYQKVLAVSRCPTAASHLPPPGPFSGQSQNSTAPGFSRLSLPGRCRGLGGLPGSGPAVCLKTGHLISLSLNSHIFRQRC